MVPAQPRDRTLQGVYRDSHSDGGLAGLARGRSGGESDLTRSGEHRGGC